MGRIRKFEEPDILHRDAVPALGAPAEYTDFHEVFLWSGFVLLTIKVTGFARGGRDSTGKTPYRVLFNDCEEVRTQRNVIIIPARTG
jgi:hypothetical protein